MKYRIPRLKTPAVLSQETVHAAGQVLLGIPHHGTVSRHAGPRPLAALRCRRHHGRRHHVESAHIVHIGWDLGSREGGAGPWLPSVRRGVT
jgi:hypothetical protein